MFPRLCALKVWCFTRGRPGRTGKICTGYFWSVQSVNVENYIKNILRFKKALEKLLDFRTNFPLFSLHNKKRKMPSDNNAFACYSFSLYHSPANFLRLLFIRKFAYFSFFLSQFGFIFVPFSICECNKSFDFHECLQASKKLWQEKSFET